MLESAIIEESKKLNFDISSYQFTDLELELAVRNLHFRDQKILILYLMGHKHEDIARIINRERSLVSKRLKQIIEILSVSMNSGF